MKNKIKYATGWDKNEKKEAKKNNKKILNNNHRQIEI